MVIESIYERYQLMGALRSHQYRVAAVAMYICGHISIPVDRDNIVAACLLHDMGNILKFDLDLYPEFLKPEGREYWQRVKKSYLKRYGSDEHLATHVITEEILSVLDDKNSSSQSSQMELSVTRSGVLKYVTAIGFSHAKENADGDDFSAKIATYADARVTPFGISSMQDRLSDGKVRFNRNKPLEERSLVFAIGKAQLAIIETQIFEKTSCKPDDITEECTQDIQSALRSAVLCLAS